MFASLLLVAAGAVLVSGQGMFFKSSAVKGYGDSRPQKALGPYYIPDRQCSGVLRNLTRACRYVTVVRVEAVDAQAYPDVSIDALLESAAVRRRAGPAGCVGRVRVHVAVGCGEARRTARASPPELPLEPPPRPLPPMSPPPLLSAADDRMYK